MSLLKWKQCAAAQAANQPDLNLMSVCGPYYSLWTDDCNCLVSYLSAHTKGNPQSGKMDKQLSKRHDVCFTSTTINKYKKIPWLIFLRKKVLPWLLTASLLSFPLTPSPPLSASIATFSSNVHSCSLTGRAFEMHCYIAGGLLGVWIQLGLMPLCALSLLQPIQEFIVIEVFMIQTPAVQAEVKGLTPAGTNEHIRSQSMSEPTAM